ncbi:MAG: DsrE family protein [Zhongshania sp.]|uniref:DsrE family protein n=1 Tax=Zhongshania guokunii TaxID=641783 RepID=A0ABV3UA27_9GAMM|nr:DsrE family protein [Zhongshania sp.]MDF1691634.1 DsrE family protein [Zhongshania sp.]
MKFLYIFTRSAYGNSIAREALDMALASAAFDQEVSLVFAQEAIYQLVMQQNSANTEKKPHLGVINALPLYDIDDIYYLAEDSSTYNLPPAALVPQAKALSAEQFSSLMSSADRIQSF